MKTGNGCTVKQAVEMTAIDPVELAEYGILYNLSGEGEDTGNVNHSAGDGWEDTDTVGSLLDTLGTLGRTKGCGAPFTAVEMERHEHTQEAQIPAAEPIVFCMAKACQGAPLTEDIIPVILRPGYVFVLHRGVWHSASHGLLGDTYYYWMALAYQNEPTLWADIADGPVRVEV